MLIQSTALLEFSLLKEPESYQQTIEKIDRALALERKGGKVENLPAKTDTATTQEKPKESKDKAISVGELFGEGTISRTDSTAGDSTLLVDDAMFQDKPFLALLRSISQIGREVNAPVENVAAVDRVLQRSDIQKLIPADSRFLWSAETFTYEGKSYRELYFLKKEPELTGKYLTNAQVTIGSGGDDIRSAGKPVVNFELNRQGARIFSRVTGANLKKRLAIVLDNRVFTAPTIQSKIPYGRGEITGIGEMDEAKRISIVLKAGALPAPVQVIEERVVGPSLGLDSIHKGTLSALLGAALVVAFMVLYYRGAGLIANLALFLNILFLLAALSMLRGTLTMPGIAGIVLTIGMAVDANVLIFERIREELATGKTVLASIDAGYRKAFTAIADSNITTIITAAVLLYFGTSAVKGFAITLIIGLIINLFTAVFVTRLLYDLITSRRTLTKLSI
jgi:preprotein translocase subunit SecD